MTTHKFEIGQKVIYEGLIGIIETKSTYVDGRPSYGLVAEQNSEISCTADEQKCELYTGQEIDQREALLTDDYNSARILGTVGKITDKYFRDGCH
jgi:hypothetical protein